MSIDFRAFEILPSNVQLACEKVKHRFELEAKVLETEIKRALVVQGVIKC